MCAQRLASVMAFEVKLESRWGDKRSWRTAAPQVKTHASRGAL